MTAAPDNTRVGARVRVAGGMACERRLDVEVVRYLGRDLYAVRELDSGVEFTAHRGTLERGTAMPV